MLRFAALLLACACASKQSPLFSLDGPPLVQVPFGHAGVDDGRARFREIFRWVCSKHELLAEDDPKAERYLWRFADEPEPDRRGLELGALKKPIHLIIVPGLLGESFVSKVSPFSGSTEKLAPLGVRTDLLVVSGRSSAGHNALQIRDAMMDLEYRDGEHLVLLGHSKGAVDLLVALVRFPEVRARADAMISVAGAIGGSPLADTATDAIRKALREGPWPNSPRGDAGAIRSLERPVRQRWLAEHELPGGLLYLSLGSFVRRDEASPAARKFHDQLAAIDPRNDSMLLFSDQVIPAGTLLGFARADHWAVVLPLEEQWQQTTAIFMNRNEFPRTALLESLLRYVDEALAQ